LQLFFEKNDPGDLIRVLRWMVGNLLEMLPLVVCGIGICNMHRWALWGAVAVCAINLVIFIFTPHAFSAMVVKSEVIIGSILRSSVTLLCNGPVGDLLVLLATPTLRQAAAILFFSVPSLPRRTSPERRWVLSTQS
jgi:hypothetical protein